jgi:uncharacterized protein (TIGR00297 family)
MSFLALLAIGLLLNAAASALVLWRGSLDAGGAAVGTVVGTLIFACGGPLFWVVLMAFFISSTGLGYTGRSAKKDLEQIHQKGGRRDLVQVLANGGIGMIAAVLFRLTSDPAWAAAFAVSFASSNADTWAGEIGVLSRRAPVSLLGFRSVRRGVSGGVSALGTAASLGGALFIAVIFAALSIPLGIFPGAFLRLAAFITAAGFTGALLDSLLGATLQAQYAPRPPGAGAGAADLLTERSRGEDGQPNRLVRGLRFVNNDAVNLASCALVTAAAVLLAPVLL